MKNKKHFVIFVLLVVVSLSILFSERPNKGISIKKDVDYNNDFKEEDIMILTQQFQGYLWDANGKVVCNAINNQKEPKLCTDGEGGAIITWIDNSDDISLFAQRINSSGGIEWINNGIVVFTATDSISQHQICSDGEGGAIITWVKGYGNADIYAQRINATGDKQWGENSLIICNADSVQVSPDLCIDDFGNVVITWQDGREMPIYYIYAQKISIAGSLLWEANGIKICNRNYKFSGQFKPQLCSDDNGGVIITWYDYRNEKVTFLANADIFAQRIGSTGDLIWDSEGITLCNADEWQGIQKICSDNNGGAIVVWTDERGTKGLDWEDIRKDIYAQRINSSGGVEWENNGSLICNAIGHQEFPQICSDGTGGAIIAWPDPREDNHKLYSQRINITGDVLWKVNGTLISNEIDFQFETAICGDGAGGAVTTWAKGFDSDVFVQRINSTGEIEWETNGEVISNSENTQKNPQILYDKAGTGNVIITWEDNREDIDNNDIYAQKVIIGTKPDSDLTDRGITHSGFTPSEAQPDATSLTVWCNVENTGTIAIDTFTVSYYASSDNDITASDYLIGTDTISSITSGGYADSSCEGTLPSGIPDSLYYIGWIIDSNNNVDESNEVNNVACISTSQLLVDSIAPSSLLSYIPEKAPNIVNTSTSFSLSANDGTGSGVKDRKYRIDGGAWMLYTISFTLENYGDGTHIIDFFSTDNVENAESINREIVRIGEDHVPPDDGDDDDEDDDDNNNEQSIPGYDLLFLVTTLFNSIIVITIIYKRRKI